MNLRQKLRRYAEQAPNPQLNLSLPKTELRQAHRNYTPYGAAMVWLLDFERALNQLKPTGRTLLLLVHGCGYRHVEAAMLMGMSLRTVQRKLRESEDQLTDVLEEQETGTRFQRCKQRWVQ